MAINTEDINNIDLEPFKARIKGYQLKKDKVIDESYTVEDVLIVGLRLLARDKKWYAENNNQAEKLATLKTAITELGGDPEEYLSKM